MKILRDIRPGHLELSGPHVWPRNTVETAWDRFIIRRPELAYMIAKERIQANRESLGIEPADSIRTVIFRTRRQPNGPDEIRSLRKFHHFYLEDPLDDVKQYLEALRLNLVRVMPDKPLTDGGIQLRFDDHPLRKNSIVAWRENWL